MQRLSNLKNRVLEPELMDDPSLPVGEHRAALDALARVNRLSAVATQLWPLLAAAAPAKILDLGSGGGEIAIAIARRARRRGVELAVTGSDVSERAVERARIVAARSGAAVDFVRLDALASELPEHDIVMCTLMLHHLDESDACRLLSSMGQAARKLVVVCDLDRSVTGLALAWVGTRILSRSRVAQVDGERSVRAAFRPHEVLALAQKVGLSRPRVRRAWPCRWILTASHDRSARSRPGSESWG